MEEPAGESLDGSSIKPVSSLRSHFEQMAKSKPKKPPPSGALSPRPVLNSNDSSNGYGGRLLSEATVSAPDMVEGLRGREMDAGDTAVLRSPRSSNPANMSLSPTRESRPRHLPPPATPLLTIQSPTSPPKVKTMDLIFSNTPAHLTIDSPMSAASSSSPRQNIIPSRPHTPLLESGKSPKLSASRPPSPPPPRRSGELRREAPRGVPPPVSRSDKPKIASKPVSLSAAEAITLAPGSSQTSYERSSPFSTPPSSGSSPENELPPPTLPGPRPRASLEQGGVNQVVQMSFQPPPVHHSVASKRKDQDVNGLGRGHAAHQVFDDEKPSLPSRPSDASKPRDLRNPLMPPPPRPPIDKGRPSLHAPTVAAPISTNPPTFATPPKRVFSSPTTQQQQLQPPRPHGRSMTVDRASDRAPAEFRTPLTAALPLSETTPSSEMTPAISYIKDALHPNLGEYPDSSQSNRRPPYFKSAIREISTKYDTRILDVNCEFVCTTGHLTRVWSLIDGEIVMSLAHTEGIKIVSMCFKPMGEVKDEGSRIWLGNNIGDLMEVDVATQSIVASKANAHTRREIIKMYRHLNEIWTLDDGGTLHLWAPDKSGSPSLSNPFQTFRVPKGHTFSMVVGNQLWHAAGKEIRVFMPTIDSSVQFQVLARPLNQPNTGDITSGCVISSQSKNVYFGHADGKVSIYSQVDYSCIGVVNISVYKITSLASVDSALWAGFSTGMVYVYDTTQSPWVVKKDWRAHHDSAVTKLIADPSSYWSLDRSQVISLGQDSMIRVWDGLLQEDWLDYQMQAKEAEYCELKPIKALVMTWNAGASTPFNLQHSSQDSTFFRDLIRSSDSPDILVFGFQELVDLEDKKTTAKSFFKSKKKDDTDQQHMSHRYRDWRDFLTRCLDDYMPRDELYHLLHTASLVGLFTCVFVRASLRDRIRSISGAEVKRGMGGLHGNKGALVLRFVLDDTSLCFINCHLAAGQTQTKDRNTDITMILESAILPTERDPNTRQDCFTGGGDGTMIMDHEICILNGDLNYRIDTMGRDTVVSAVKSMNLNKLLERDQLLASKRKNPWFKLRAFNELPITFAPTYKYDVGTDNYDTSEKKRSPAWCDRLLYRGKDRVTQLDYRRHEVRVSDHRPVTGLFRMMIKSIEPRRRQIVWDECQKRLAELKDRAGSEARMNYLTNVLGFDAATSKLIVQKGKPS